MSASSVLLVDDRDENLLTMEAVLAPLGCRLVKVRSGDEALKALLTDRFAVIVLDVQMPGMDGLQTAEIIRSRPRTERVPIIFVTGVSTAAQDIFRGYRTGAVDYVLKPFDPVVLRSKVEVFVELHERGEALALREELLRATLEHAPIGTARADSQGRLLQINAAFAATLGRRPEAIEGRTLDELGFPDQAGIDSGQREDLLAGRIIRYEVERDLLGPGAVRVPALVSVGRMEGGPGVPSDLVIHVQDISDRRNAAARRVQLARAQAARAQAESAAERLRVTEAIARTALDASGLDGLLDGLLGLLVDALECERAAIMLEGSPERLVCRLRSGGEPSAAELAAVRALGASARRLRGAVTAREGAAAATTVVAVPLMAADEIVGNVQVAFREGQADDVTDLLRLAADRAGLVIQRMRLFEREHRIAVELQRSLLPERLPDVPGVQMAARLHAGGDGVPVGGDWYDAIALPAGRVGLIIGDVVGRGMEAAAIMGQLRSAARAVLMQDEPDVGVALERINRFAGTMGDAMMATLLVGVLEPTAGILRYAHAGHPPLAVARADGTAAFAAHPPGPPLGVLDGVEYRQHEHPISSGDTLILYTDGLIERPGEILDAGLDRLLSGCREIDAGADAAAVCDQLLAVNGAGAEATDDVTVFVVRALPVLGPRVALDVHGTPTSLRATRLLVRRWAVEAGATGKEGDAIVMACNEACQNAVEHAHGLRDRAVQLLLEAEGSQLELRIRDHGTWGAPGDPDRGRGMELMHALVDEVVVDSRPTGTVLTLRRRVGGAAHGTPLPWSAEAPAPDTGASGGAGVNGVGEEGYPA